MIVTDDKTITQTLESYQAERCALESQIKDCANKVAKKYPHSKEGYGWILAEREYSYYAADREQDRDEDEKTSIRYVIDTRGEFWVYKKHEEGEVASNMKRYYTISPWELQDSGTAALEKVMLELDFDICGKKLLWNRPYGTVGSAWNETWATSTPFDSNHYTSVTLKRLSKEKGYGLYTALSNIVAGTTKPVPINSKAEAQRKLDAEKAERNRERRKILLMVFSIIALLYIGYRFSMGRVPHPGITLLFSLAAIIIGVKLWNDYGPIL